MSVVGAEAGAKAPSVEGGADTDGVVGAGDWSFVGGTDAGGEDVFVSGAGEVVDGADPAVGGVVVAGDVTDAGTSGVVDDELVGLGRLMVKPVTCSSSVWLNSKAGSSSARNVCLGWSKISAWFS